MAGVAYWSRLVYTLEGGGRGQKGGGGRDEEQSGRKEGRRRERGEKEKGRDTNLNIPSH